MRVADIHFRVWNSPFIKCENVFPRVQQSLRRHGSEMKRSTCRLAKYLRKRKIEGTELDEAERSLYSSFRKAVGSVTSLYSSQKEQTLFSFEAGKRRAVHTLYRWISSAHQQGSVTSIEEILYHLHGGLCAGGDLFASTETQYQIHLAPQGQEQTQLEEQQPDHIVISDDVDPTVAAYDSCLGHPGWIISTVNQKNQASSNGCDYSQSSSQLPNESHTREDNDSNMDMNCL